MRMAAGFMELFVGRRYAWEAAAALQASPPPPPPTPHFSAGVLRPLK